MITAEFLYPDNGYPSDVECAKQHGLQQGGSYEVRTFRVGQSRSAVYLCGYNPGFNTVQFKFYEDGNPLDPCRDERFSPYMMKNRRKT